MIWIDLAAYAKNLNGLPNNALNGLESGKKNLNGLKKNGWARFGPKWLNGAGGAQRGRFGPRKKPD